MSFSQDDPQHWTLNLVCQLAPKPLDQLARTIIRKLACQRLVLGRCLVALDRNLMARRLGFSGAVHYATHHGVHERAARDARRVAAAVEDLPLLREAAEAGTVAWASLREIVRKATVETEARWLDLARSYGPKVIERLVGQTQVGEEPGGPETLDGEPPAVHLHFIVDAETSELYQRVVRDMSLEAGRPLGGVEVLAGLCLDRLGSSARERDRIRNEARKDAAARHEREARVGRPARVTDAPEFSRDMVETEMEPDRAGARPARATDAPEFSEEAEQAEDKAKAARSERAVLDSVNGGGGRGTQGTAAGRSDRGEGPVAWGESAGDARLDDDPAPATPFAALAARVEACPSDVGVKLLRTDKPDWANPRLRFSPAARQATPAQRTEMMRRDGYCCSVPGCPNRLWLDLHHVVFYCLGGVTLPHNLVVVCTACHGNLHRGWLRVTGTAPDGLLWTDRWGNPLGGS